MNRFNVKINGLDTESYNVLSQGNPRIELPKLNFKRLTIPGRIIPQYQKEPDKTPGTLELVLNGVFESEVERVAFETDILHKLNNQAISTIELESSKGVEYQCLLSSPIEIQEITNHTYAQGCVVVTYTLDFLIELYIKK